jgi:hypothetical protein
MLRRAAVTPLALIALALSSSPAAATLTEWGTGAFAWTMDCPSFPTGLVSASPIPEPGTAALLGFGLVALARWRSAA